MYCPECGYQIEEEETRFCPECGTRVLDEIEIGGECMPSRETDSGVCGIIMTNVYLLAQKMKAQEADVRLMLKRFIEEKKDFGIYYRLADVSQYTFHRQNILGFSKTIHLKDKSSVWEYMDVLADELLYDTAKYLFIIGGDDIVPMPCVQHFANDCDDTTIDTDILYAYPYGKDSLAMLENATLFEREPLLMVGRLPVEKDTSFEEWSGYLERSLKCSIGIPVAGAYAQCDPNWKNISVSVAGRLIDDGWLMNMDGRLSGDYYYHRLILSPRIDAISVEQVFRSGASLYYYNLHGSDKLEERSYIGCTTSKLMSFPVLFPEHMSSCTNPNLVISEACYGARFIGLDKKHSMLLASLYSNTLAYVGSSRIAWGTEDPRFMTGHEVLLPQCADVIARMFIDAMMQGYTVGEAMLLSRMRLLEQDVTPHALASVVEFNLFGDPTLAMRVEKSKRVEMKECKMRNMGFVVEKIETSEAGLDESPLQRVRQAIDDNTSWIQNNIGKHLYSRYGLEPRPANYIYKLEYSDGIKELNFVYKVPSEAIKQMEYVVRTTEEGKVKSVIVTK